ncbi:MAG: ferritin [Candidatus Poribacteria bacterium]|nr:ferritin [Candidatus Poribacteria bacterium]
MIGKRIQDAINDQIQAEMFSSYLYLSMSAYFHSINMGGMANWMKVQAQEENGHAMKFFQHVIDRGGRIELMKMDKPKTDWASPLEAFQDAYKHEQYITERINNLVKIAMEETDNPASIILQWFVNEQVEEEANTSKIVERLERVGESPNGLFMLDSHLGERK